MPVISPRRSSTSGSGSLYGTTSSTTGGSSPSSAGSSGYSSAASYINRASSLSKATSPSTYNPSFSLYLSSYPSYSPRSPSHRSSLSSSYLSGGSTGLGTYRCPSSYLGSGFGSGSNDSITSSRYGITFCRPCYYSCSLT